MLEFVSDAGFWGCTVIAKTRLIASCPQILYSNVSCHVTFSLLQSSWLYTIL